MDCNQMYQYRDLLKWLGATLVQIGEYVLRTIGAATP